MNDDDYNTLYSDLEDSTIKRLQELVAEIDRKNDKKHREESAYKRATADFIKENKAFIT